MQYSIVGGQKMAPFPKGKGECPLCGNSTIAKCGKQIRWHWAHETSRSCDPWWENETDWHRMWKRHWPIENQEVVHFDDTTGEKHIADVKTNDGLVVEFQNSPMSEKELSSREVFYRNMIWIVNAEKFKQNIFFGCKLPNPKHDESKDMIIYPLQQPENWFGFYRRSENEPDATMVLVHGSHHIQEFIDSTHDNHYMFYWKKPRAVWYKSTVPVYLDFGNDILWELQRFNERSPFCLKAACKNFVISKLGGKFSA